MNDIFEKKRSLIKMLQKAMEIELSTLPPYITAAVSIKDGTNKDAALIIHSVFMEEMLHMVLVANIIAALDGYIKLGKENIPTYPLILEFESKTFKGREFAVNIAPFSREAIETFLKIELPTRIPSLIIEGYTVGEFYNNIQEKLSDLCKEFGEEKVFSENTNRQIGREYYWGYGNGEPIIVTNLESALKAMDVIIEQGEGADNSIDKNDNKHVSHPKKIGHFFRFKEIAEAALYNEGDNIKGSPSGNKIIVDYNAVYPVILNPKSDYYAPGSELYILNSQFNYYYTLMLKQLEEGFNKDSKIIYTAILNSMNNLTPLAKKMVKIPIPNNKEGKHGAPSFEWQDSALESG